MKTYRLPCGVGDRVVVSAPYEGGKSALGVVHKICIDEIYKEWTFIVNILDDKNMDWIERCKIASLGDKAFLESDFGKTVRVCESDDSILKWERPVPTTIKSYTRICPYCGRNAYVIGNSEYKFCPHCGKEVAI